MTVRALLPALLLALLGPLVAGQVTVDPQERYLVLTAGKSGKVTLDAGDCSPTWTASSSDEGVATVSPAGPEGGSKRSFTIKTGGQGSATVTISASGVGEGCAEDLDTEIFVLAVMDAKAVSKFFKKGLKGQLKGLKGTTKTVLKEHADELGEILAQLEDETLGLGEGAEGEPMLTHAQMADLAVSLGEDAMGDSFESIFSAYKSCVMGMANEGIGAALNYGFGGFLEYLPPGFFDGGCGEWDAATADAWALFVDTVEKLDALAKTFDQSVVKLVAAEGGLSVVGASYEVPEFTTGNLSVLNAAKTFDAASEKKLKQKRPKATNYVDEQGSNQHGRIRAKGKADPEGGAVTVTYERLDGDTPVGMGAGDFFEEEDVTVQSDCSWRSYAPGVADTPDLRPGTWRVTVTQDGKSVVREVVVPLPKS